MFDLNSSIKARGTAIKAGKMVLIHVCSGSVVVTAYDSESGCPGLKPEWGLPANIL